MPNQPGICEPLAPGIRRILAPNPSPMTLHGTNSYLVGTGEVALIDPGPNDPAHARALMAALDAGERITHIFVTHAHLDHSPLAREMAAALNIRTHAFGPATAGRSPLMEALAQNGTLAGGEGIDFEFTPDVVLSCGDVLTHGDWALEAIHTPGHLGNHLCFAMQDPEDSARDVLFSGDHVMGWASSLVSPPDGDMAAYMAATRRLAARDWSVIHSGHGDPILDPAARLAFLIAHRESREAGILAELSKGTATITELTAALYAQTPPALHPAAARNILAHLLDLTAQARVTADPAPGPAARYALA
ncbi:MBL fold metallo-hydrolase [Pseudorhodobacter aquimaris]|uniref:MBL fold metallo-hydrolase n=1 Tax=Pseudorhodobacter aquimaris TaxID=687412 RepID=UPI00067B9C56|nr:MBL fold metallo-hydrolase [Pseudorhodobacter aquimaris]